MDYVGETFRDVRVELDGNSFRECMFERVTFYYEGGPISVDGCNIGDFRFELGGNLANGLQALAAFYRQGGPKSTKRLVDSISALLRKSDPVQTFTIG